MNAGKYLAQLIMDKKILHMKTNRKIYRFTSIMAIVIILFSCSQDDWDNFGEVLQERSLWEKMQASTEYPEFQEAVIKAGMVEMLNGNDGKKYTLIAPNRLAFDDDTMFVASRLTQEEAKDMVESHIIEGEHLLRVLAEENNETEEDSLIFTTLNNETIVLKGLNNVNGTTLQTAGDWVASNGRFYRVFNLLWPVENWPARFLEQIEE